MTTINLFKGNKKRKSATCWSIYRGRYGSCKYKKQGRKHNFAFDSKSGEL